jgi:hypothetical protein
MHTRDSKFGPDLLRLPKRVKKGEGSPTIPHSNPVQPLDILKNIMVNCSNISFSLFYSHVQTHQDDQAQYVDLPRPEQLNCQIDYHAKKAIWDTGQLHDKVTRRFPLEPVCVFLGKNKLTFDNGDELRFWVHWKLARSAYHDMKILDVSQFDKVDLEMVHALLWRVP